jgi:nitrogenase molybdenum-cofactor synthesis protein NifE
MDYLENSFPIPSDYFGVLWALAGIKNAKVIEHGSTGTVAYNNVNFGILNYLKPKGILFSSGLDEDDVVMGGEEKIVKGIKEIDELYHPKLISVVATGVTSVIGLDLEGITGELKEKTNAKLLTFSGGGFRGNYSDGIEEVFNTLAKEVVKESKIKNSKAVNLIGTTVDSFNLVSDIQEIKRLLGLLGVKVNTVFTQETDVEAIEKMSQVGLNIVTSDIGIETAKILEGRFGTPWYYGLPFGIKGTVKWLENIANIMKIKINKAIIANEIKKYGKAMGCFTSFFRPFDKLRIGLSGSNEYIKGLVEFLGNECEMNLSFAVIKESHLMESTIQELKKATIGEILINPDVNELKKAINYHKPHILFGNTYELNTSSEIPIKIHSGFPCFDYVNFHDGTPFVGFKGNMYLIQLLINSVNQHPEVWSI